MEARGIREGRRELHGLSEAQVWLACGKPRRGVQPHLSSIQGGPSAQGQPGLIGSLCKVKIMRHTRELQFIHFNLKIQVMNHVYPHMEVVREVELDKSEETKIRISSALTLSHLLLSYTHTLKTTASKITQLENTLSP